MSKLIKVAQKLFGSTAGPNQISKFGSFEAGSPAFTTDPAQIQSLPEFLTGWFGAVAMNAGNPSAPAIEDENALHVLWARQIAYGFQAGVAEWDTDTVYYINSVVQSGGALWISLTDNNQGNAVVEGADWSSITGVSVNGSVSSPGVVVVSGGGSITAGSATFFYRLTRMGNVVNFSIRVSTNAGFTVAPTVFGLGIPIPAGFAPTTTQVNCGIGINNNMFYRGEVTSAFIFLLKIDTTLNAANWAASEDTGYISGSYLLY